ncbi:hypothetical protein AAC387_Pa07g1425 [Persea americana]
MEEITSPNQQKEIFLAPSSSHNDGNGRVQDEAHISFNMGDLDPNWVSSIKERHLVKPRRLTVSSTSISCSIHRVPDRLRQHNDKAYVPQIISIGPFHYKRRKAQLQVMEEHKWRYLHDILSRNREGSLEQYLVAVKELEERARDCYSEVITLDSNSFVEMMVLDGCFIIELFRKYLIEDFNDVIFRFDWLIKAVIADLIMLENQIPFFILQCLFDLIDGTCPSPLLVERAFNFFCMLNLSRMTRIKRSTIQIQHLLHLVYTYDILFPDEGCSGKELVLIPCASKLEKRGIKFRERVDIIGTGNFLDIKFQDGVIEIPPMLVLENSNIRFLNLIAFEQCYCHCQKYITSWFAFMDCLIKTSKDVEILRRRGIIIDGLGSEERVAALFNNMGRELSLPYNNFYFSGVCKEINQYNERAWPKLRASLVDDYFKSPWSITIFFAALLLLLLLITQTFFSSFPKFAYGD